MSRRQRMAWGACVLLAVMGTCALAGGEEADDAEAGVVRAGAVDQEEETAVAADPIRRPASRSTADAEGGSPGGMNLVQVAASLAIVIGLIFALRWAGQRLLGAPGGGRGTSAVEVLSRTVIGPRQQLMLMRIGRRLVLVSNTQTQMNPLCEIADPEEVAELLGQIRAEKSDSIAKTFGTMFRREEEKFASAGVKTDALDAEPTAPGEPGEPGVEATREELSGLMDKVRGLSRQFQK